MKDLLTQRKNKNSEPPSDSEKNVLKCFILNLFIIQFKLLRYDSNRVTKPHRGITMVASRLNGWKSIGRGRACRRYATTHYAVVAYLRHAYLRQHHTSRSNGWLPLSDAYGILWWYDYG